MAPSPALDPATRDTIVVRDGTGDDRDAVRAVIVAAYTQYEPVVGTAFLTRYIADLTDLERHARHGQLIVAEINGKLATALTQRDVMDRVAALGADLAGGAPERLSAHLNAEIPKWREVVRAADIKL